MAFPTSPSNEDYYTTANGVKYQYVSADDKWIIVSGNADAYAPTPHGNDDHSSTFVDAAGARAAINDVIGSDGKLDADLDADSTHKITNIAAGTTDGDSVRYEQVIGVMLPIANLENPPTEDEDEKAPTSEWAYDHAAGAGVHPNLITFRDSALWDHTLTCDNTWRTLTVTSAASGYSYVIIEGAIYHASASVDLQVRPIGATNEHGALGGNAGAYDKGILIMKIDGSRQFQYKATSGAAAYLHTIAYF